MNTTTPVTRKAGRPGAILVAAVLVAAHASAAAAGVELDPPVTELAGTYGYHVRLVRLAVEPDEPGAAVGPGKDSGVPVVLPSEERWGSPEQLQGLADLLGVATAEPAGGFFLQSSDGQEFRFERRVYVGGTVADLSFRAVPPVEGGRAHRIELALRDVGSPEPALAEATLLLSTDRTVAVAIPGLPDGDGLVLAVTSIAPAETAARLREATPVHLLDATVTAPRVVHQEAVRYPESARRDRLTGEVILQLIIDHDGVPRAPTVLRMTPGCEELAGAAVEAVQRWRYEPAMLEDRPVAVWFTVVVRFSLE